MIREPRFTGPGGIGKIGEGAHSHRRLAGPSGGAAEDTCRNSREKECGKVWLLWSISAPNQIDTHYIWDHNQIKSLVNFFFTLVLDFFTSMFQPAYPTRFLGSQDLRDRKSVV